MKGMYVHDIPHNETIVICRISQTRLMILTIPLFLVILTNPPKRFKWFNRFNPVEPVLSP